MSASENTDVDAADQLGNALQSGPGRGPPRHADLGGDVTDMTLDDGTYVLYDEVRCSDEDDYEPAWIEIDVDAVADLEAMQ